MKLSQDYRAIVSQFQIHGEVISVEPFGNGHINDTFCAACNQGGTLIRYVLQRINQNVFKNPVALMENIQRATTHLAGKLVGQPDFSRSMLTLIPARDNQVWHCDAEGRYWRAYIFIEKASTYEIVESPRQAFEVAKAFGRFQKLLADLPAPTLHETIPDFHHTPKRFIRLENAITRNAVNRARLVKPEIEFALQHKSITNVLLDAGLPQRITHNDTKLNNVMLDDATGEGICVIDLDTVMAGFALSDFGDMVRTSVSPAKEDERDLSKVVMQFPMYEALVRGYLEATADFLTKVERQYLAFAGKLITFEIGIRFLTDFLEGDTYFKVHRENHNLDRCRTQFKLVESLEQQEARMVKLTEEF